VAAAVAAGCIPRRGGYWPIARPRGARAPSLSRSLPRARVRASVCRREERESGVMEGRGEGARGAAAAPPEEESAPAAAAAGALPLTAAVRCWAPG
jgi:hypothetical protein